VPETTKGDLRVTNPPAAPAGAAGGFVTRKSPFVVRVEALSWVNELLGGSGTGLYGHDLTAAPGETVRDVLLRASGACPKLGPVLWDRGTTELGEHLEVIVNGTVLGVHHTLATPVAPGDKILLLGQFQGG
jgi:hypothetical protein